MGATCTIQTQRNSCKFVSKSDQKKRFGYGHLIIQVSDPVPSLPSCLISLELRLITHSHTMTPFDAPGKQAF